MIDYIRILKANFEKKQVRKGSQKVRILKSPIKMMILTYLQKIIENNNPLNLLNVDSYFLKWKNQGHNLDFLFPRYGISVSDELHWIIANLGYSGFITTSPFQVTEEGKQAIEEFREENPVFFEHLCRKIKEALYPKKRKC